ncbi:hypothetical protein F4779DRAFT_74922 [Xylariaceae sp. FL0662B]|nr:hypothetical protein F4779DRAFT_74922 [Xylariaceae sp. FL0662B]
MSPLSSPGLFLAIITDLYADLHINLTLPHSEAHHMAIEKVAHLVVKCTCEMVSHLKYLTMLSLGLGCMDYSYSQVNGQHSHFKHFDSSTAFYQCVSDFAQNNEPLCLDGETLGSRCPFGTSR